MTEEKWLGGQQSFTKIPFGLYAITLDAVSSTNFGGGFQELIYDLQSREKASTERKRGKETLEYGFGAVGEPVDHWRRSLEEMMK